MRSLGADEMLDYRSDDLAAVRDVDVAVATVPGQAPALAAMLRPEGLVVALDGADGPAATDAEGVYLLVEPDRAGLDALAAMVLEGSLRVLVDRVFPLAEAASAHELGEAGHVTGKLVPRT
ncbi:zinc-binding dehydrogenase [Dactylosporangium salmoneum]|uniref:Zinc-binding dehydrogenase n=1 Tax=Dactylosporangium salmoneum TaxID=53361 RepID=A0ABP5V2H5_9ACTN